MQIVYLELVTKTAATLKRCEAIGRYPVFLTMCHMVGGSLMGWAFFALSRYPRQTITSRRQLSKILVLAAVFCLSVVLGNASLRFIPVSFAQVCSNHLCSLLQALADAVFYGPA